MSYTLGQADGGNRVVKPLAKDGNEVHNPNKQITISRETTYFTDPLDEHGFVDYERAINRELSQGIKPENNAFCSYLHSVNNLIRYQESPISTADMQRLEEYLGKEVKRGPAGILDIWSYLLITAEQQAKTDSKINTREISDFGFKLDGQANQPWKREDLPEVAAFLKQFEPALKAINEGTNGSEYYAPTFTSFADRLNPDINDKFRFVSRGMVYKIMLAIREQHFEEALDDLLLMSRFSRDISRGGTILGILTGTFLENKCNQAGALFIKHCHDDTLLVKYFQGFEKIPPPHEMAKSCYHIDRAEVLNLLHIFIKHDLGYLGDEEFQKVLDAINAPFHSLSSHHSKTSVQRTHVASFEIKEDAATLLKLQQGSYDWDKQTRAVNQRYDSLKMALELPRQRRKKKLLELYSSQTNLEVEQKAEQKLNDKDNNQLIQDGKFTTWFSYKFMSSPEYYINREERMRMLNGIQKLGINLKRYQLKYGKYPEELNQLVPEYQASIPVDLFSDAQLKYSKLENGFKLYSVGVNEKDDNGHGDDSKPRGDDLLLLID